MAEFEIFLSRLEFCCDIYILTESWSNKTTNFPTLSGYNINYSKNNNNQNDGIVVYTRNDLSCNVHEILISDATCLTVKLNTDTIVFGIYRSPSYRNINNFLDSLNDILKLYSKFPNIIIMGDINIDIKTNSVDSKAPDYLNLLASHGILPSHEYPTRGNNCLDHALIKSKYPTKTIIITSSITDHYSVVVEMKVNKTPKPKYKSVIHKLNHDKLVSDIGSFNFDDILCSMDANWAANRLVGVLSNLVTTNTTTLTVTRRTRCIKPWITPGLIRCMKNRDTLHLKLKKDPTNTILKITYTRYRNFCNDLLKRIKRSYEQDQLKKCSKNAKTTWKLIKTYTNSQTNKQPAIDLLKIKETPEKSVEYVNHYFADVGKSLASKITSTSSDHLTNLTSDNFSNKTVNSMYMSEVTDQDILNVINNLKNDCATGWDNIPTNIIKSTKNILAPLLKHIVNLSINSGVFPQAFKTSIVHPIYKHGDKNCISNYRPISILTVFAKILEKIINNKLLSYLDKENILSNNQYGFRARKSTKDAVSDLYEFVGAQLDKKFRCVGVFLDLAKAFDTVSIPMLLRKLESIGIRGTVHKLFTDYLSNRKQRVKLGDHCSSDVSISYGVPQGSVLGPSLFLIYINELCNINLPNCKIITYADDTALVFYDKSWVGATTKAETGLGIVSQWMQNNSLTLNVSKTKVIYFGISKRCIPGDYEYPIRFHSCGSRSMQNSTCNCMCLTKAETINYLGVQLDNTLSWKNHINLLSKRTRKLIYVFKTLRHIAEFNLLKSVYFALAQSILSYCITSWGGTCKTRMIELERAQRALLKVMTFKPFRYPTKDLYANCDVLTVRQLFIKETILDQHSKLVFSDEIASARRKDKVCYLPPVKTSFAQRFQFFLGPSLYNKVNAIINIYPLNTKKCKEKLINWLKDQNYHDIEKMFSLTK